MNSIDIDTGGTFTDGVFRFDRRVVTVKVDTTPHDPVKCFMTCIDEGARLLGKDRSELLAAMDVVRYATTSATNAIVQMKGPKIGLIVSEGAEKRLYDGADPCGHDGQAPIWKFLDRSLVASVVEKSETETGGHAGLDAESFRSVVESLLDAGARILVVALREAHISPRNELRAKELFEKMLPTFYLGRPFLLLSHQVSASGTDAERLNSAVISGYLHRDLVGYLYRCDDAVRRRGYRHPLLVVHSTGGLARVAKTKALNTYNSGPTAGVFGAARIARRYGLPRIITMDLGGTSTDVAFIEDGKHRLSFQAEIENVNVSVPMIDVVGLGGGGGSIVSIDDGRIQVGPESAGAVPGPVCYDLGSSKPTVTDANAILGLISPENFLDGRRRMNLDRARQCLEDTAARPLGLGLDEAALQIRSVLAEGLAAAIREAARRRSFSMGDAVIFAYGGAGPLHAADIASAIGVSAFYMFPESPVFSAAGSSTMDVQHFYERGVQIRDDRDIAGAFNRVAGALKDRALRDMRGEGFDPFSAKLQFVFEPSKGEKLIFDDDGLLKAASEAACEGLLRLIATIEMSNPEGDSEISARASRAREEAREIGWSSGRAMTAVYSYPELKQAETIHGPALVETSETACVIPPGWHAEKDSYGALRVWKH